MQKGRSGTLVLRNRYALSKSRRARVVALGIGNNVPNDRPSHLLLLCRLLLCPALFLCVGNLLAGRGRHLPLALRSARTSFAGPWRSATPASNYQTRLFT